MEDLFARLRTRFSLDKGKEMPDPTPMAPPIGYVKQPSMVEMIRNMVRSEELRRSAERAGMETFEEADDFDVGDDYDPRSPYEAEFEPLTEVKGRARAEALKAKEAQEKSDAKARFDEGRSEDSGGRSGRRGEVRESNSKSEQKSDDGGSNRKVDRGSARSQE